MKEISGNTAVRDEMSVTLSITNTSELVEFYSNISLPIRKSYSLCKNLTSYLDTGLSSMLLVPIKNIDSDVVLYLVLPSSSTAAAVLWECTVDFTCSVELRLLLNDSCIDRVLNMVRGLPFQQKQEMQLVWGTSRMSKIKSVSKCRHFANFSCNTSHDQPN